MIESTGQQKIDINMQQNEVNKLAGFNLENKSEKELMEAAKQFEAVFINKLFKAMDSTVHRTGMFSGGRGEKMFRSMFFDEIAKSASSDPTTSFGFAKQVYEQMKDLV